MSPPVLTPTPITPARPTAPCTATQRTVLDAALGRLDWHPAHVKNWLVKHWVVERLAALTMAQADAAAALLTQALQEQEGR